MGGCEEVGRRRKRKIICSFAASRNRRNGKSYVDCSNNGLASALYSLVVVFLRVKTLCSPSFPLKLLSSSSPSSPLTPSPHTHRVTLKFAFSGPAQQSVQPLPRSLPPSESTNYFLGHPQPLSSLLLSLSRVLPLSCSFFFFGRLRKTRRRTAIFHL